MHSLRWSEFGVQDGVDHETWRRFGSHLRFRVRRWLDGVDDGVVVTHVDGKCTGVGHWNRAETRSVWESAVRIARRREACVRPRVDAYEETGFYFVKVRV